MSNAKIKPPTFEEWITDKCKIDDWNSLEEQVNDALYTNNVLVYFNGWMREHGQELLADFWNHRSDACPLESEEQDAQIIAFRQYIRARFRNLNP